MYRYSFSLISYYLLFINPIILLYISFSLTCSHNLQINFKSIFVAIYFLLGTNVTEAKKVLAESGLPILTANNLDEAARKAVTSVNT